MTMTDSLEEDESMPPENMVGKKLGGKSQRLEWFLGMQNKRESVYIADVEYHYYF